jgi:large subunit ribosomal protein L15
MQLHQIKAKTKKKNKKRIGRGGKRGTYSGKGIKGQKSRAGRKMRPQWRDIIKKLPKKRGYRFASIKKKPAVLNLDVLEKKFNENEKVTPKILFEKGIIKKIKGILPEVKLLGGGDITKPFLVSECQVSKQAKDKIEKAGGKYVE